MTVAVPAGAARQRLASPDADAMPLLLLAEVALAGVSLASAFSLRRVFLDTDWFGPIALQVLLAHGLAAVLRRRGVALLPSVALVAAAGAVTVALLYAGEFTTAGLPTPSTFDALGAEVSDALAQWGEVKAPTEALDGFLIAVSVAVWTGAILADWSAFRVDAPLESTLPSATLFVLGAVLGADVDRVLLTGVWVAAVLAFLLFRRADRLGRTSTWVGERRAHGPPALVALGAGLALAAVVVAALVGPRLPGANSEAIVSLRDLGDDSPGTRVTVSPLVDIKSRLVDQATVEVFTVRSPVRSYWRLTSLDRFDGRIWSSNGSYGKANGDLDDGVPVASEPLAFEQAYSISALSQIWLPAAYEPKAVEVPQDVRYDEVSGTLIVDTEVPTSDGLTYQVASALPQHEPGALGSAAAAVPQEIADRYLPLPDDFPESIRTKAREVVAGATSGYDASLRLQNFFRDNFTYDLDVGSGHDDRAIELFVLEVQRGYCEQFAGSFAAMARSLGIPARVAVGFTPGIATPEDPTLYRVRGEHAHAWPEVYLGEYGWVAFEPTPGRGAPLAEQYTGVPEQQVSSGGNPSTATTAVSPPTTGAASASTSSVPLPSLDELDGATAGDAADADDGPSALRRWLTRLAVAAAVLVVVVGLYLALVLALTWWRRQRRRQAAADAAAQVTLAWDESVGAVRRAGVPVRAAQTQSEVATRVGTRLPTVGDPMRTLARTVERVTYAPEPPDAEVGQEALDLADEIERAAEATMSGADRFRTRFHPQRLLR